MFKTIGTAFLCVLFILVGTFVWGETGVIAPDLEVAGAEFGIIDAQKSEGGEFIPFSHVPLVVGQGYGWRIKLKTERKSITWREEFILPGAPESWGVSEQNEIEISIDGKVAVTERTVIPENGLIENYWKVASGDPAGSYVINVYIDDIKVASFRFFVE